jgi:hypothetical protein
MQLVGRAQTDNEQGNSVGGDINNRLLRFKLPFLHLPAVAHSLV